MWTEFLSQCEDISFIIWFSGPYCDSHLKGQSKNLQYIHVRIFSQILDICWVTQSSFWPRLWLTFEGLKRKFAVRSRSNFFSNLGHFSISFNPIFYSHFKNIIFFQIGPKLTFLRCFFHGTIFLAEEFLLSQKKFNTMWIDCEKNSDVIWYCVSQCERNSTHIVAHIVRRLWGILWVEMNTLNILIWIWNLNL